MQSFQLNALVNHKLIEKTKITVILQDIPCLGERRSFNKLPLPHPLSLQISLFAVVDRINVEFIF